MRHDANPEAPSLRIHVAQKRQRAGVDRVRREHHGRTAIEGAVEAGMQVDPIAQRSLADRRLVVPDLVVDLREVDIVDPGG